MDMHCDAIDSRGQAMDMHCDAIDSRGQAMDMHCDAIDSRGGGQSVPRISRGAKRWTCIATRLTGMAAANRSLVYLMERTALHCIPEPVSSRSRTRSFCVARRGSAGLPRVTQRAETCRHKRVKEVD
jgi:hypothetical protein